MNSAKAVRAVPPCLSADAVLVTAVLLLAAAYFTLLDLQGIALLAGNLAAAILAVVSRALHVDRQFRFPAGLLPRYFMCAPLTPTC